jgi:glycosyltransferase involved in cell wall biosynthesis
MKEEGSSVVPVPALASPLGAARAADTWTVPRSDPRAEMAELAAASGISSVEIIAWRDAGHPEAGGSEVHSARIAEKWAGAGLDVQIVASRPDGAPRHWSGDGYTTTRPAGRYRIFPSTLARGALRRPVPGRATVEVWNGMPFFTPLWASQPRVVLLHHVHDRMWDTVMPGPLAAAGRLLETRLAPPLYRNTRLVTLSPSSKLDIVRRLGLDPFNVDVVPPGVDAIFQPGQRSPTPFLVAVGRLVPYKRFDELIAVMVSLKARHPDLKAVIAGDGSQKAHLEALVAAHSAQGWLALPGRVEPAELVRLYQRAWVLASSSAFEGWGLTISEAAACATPAVASPIAGHFDAVDDSRTGFLAEPGREMVDRLDLLLTDTALRRRMQHSARSKARELSWDAAATGILRILAEQATLCK